MSSKNRLLQLFNLPDNETIFEDFGCALVDNILRHGRMFVGENYICFYSTILGISTKKVIKVDEIKNIEKKSLLGFIQSAIEIVTENKSYLFSSFSKRDTAYKLLYAIWKGEPFEPEEEEEDDVPLPSGEQQQVESAEVEVLNLDNPSDDEKHEILKIILPISTQQFFEKFYSDEAGFPYSDHLQKNSGAYSIQMTNWVDSEEGNGKTREINCMIKVKGVPFRDSSRMYKIHTYKELENGEIEIRQMCKTLDVPYADCFQIEEQWSLQPIEDNPDKCKLTLTAWVVIIKNFVWKGKVQTKAIEGIKEDSEKWLKNCKKFLQDQLKKQQQANGQSAQEYEQANLLDQTQLLSTELIKKSEQKQSGQQQQLQNQLQNQQSSEATRDSVSLGKKELSSIDSSSIEQTNAQVYIILNVLVVLFMLVIVFLFVNFFYMGSKIKKLENSVQQLTDAIILMSQQSNNFSNFQNNNLSDFQNNNKILNETANLTWLNNEL